MTISQLAFSQIKAVVVDKENQKKLEYVNIWVEDKNIGTSSDNNGVFELENVTKDDFIVFSAVGYQNHRIKSVFIENKVELNQIVDSLPEVFIDNLKKERKIEFGEYKKSKINSYFACGTSPWIVAKKLDFKDEFKQTPFINNITLLTKSDIDESKFKLIIYSQNKNGLPGKPLVNENIIGKADKGKKLTKFNLSDYKIRFPKDGLFLAVEWLIIPENKFEYSFKMQDSKRKQTGISYEPAIGSIKNKKNDTWIFAKGKWRQMQNVSNKTEFQSLAIKLELTN